MPLREQIENVEPVAETLEELWLSYNSIEKLVGGMCRTRNGSVAQQLAAHDCRVSGRLVWNSAAHSHLELALTHFSSRPASRSLPT